MPAAKKGRMSGVRRPTNTSRSVWQVRNAIAPQKARASLRASAFKLFLAPSPAQPRVMKDFPFVHMSIYTAGIATAFGGENVYRLNSMFDPDFTGIGPQPQGWDQYKAIYVKYKVVAVTLEVTFTNPSTSGLIVACQLSNPNDTITLTGTSAQTSDSRYNVEQRYLNDTGSQQVTIKRRFPMEDLLGITPEMFRGDDQNFSAVIGANPARVPFVRVAIADVSGAAGQTCTGVVKIIYHTMIFSRITFPL